MTNEQIKQSIENIKNNFAPATDPVELTLQENILALAESVIVNLNDIADALRAPRQ